MVIAIAFRPIQAPAVVLFLLLSSIALPHAGAGGSGPVAGRASSPVIWAAPAVGSMTLDGVADEPSWAGAAPLVLNGTERNGNPPVTLRAVADTEFLYLHIEWSDATANRTRDTWMFNSTGGGNWSNMGEREDTLRLKWPGGNFSDLWTWSAAKTNPAGFIEDGFANQSGEFAEAAGLGTYGTVPNSVFAGDGNSTTLPFASGDAPAWKRNLTMPQSVGTDYMLRNESAAMNGSETFVNNESLPGHVLERPYGDLGDISGAAVRSGGNWSLEVMRKLATGWATDVNLSDPFAAHDFTVMLGDGETSPAWSAGESASIVLKFPHPDLTFKGGLGTLPAEPRQGDNVTVNFTVSNTGELASGGFTAEAYIDNSSLPVATITTLSVPAGGEALLSFRWNTTAVADGARNITLVLDTTGNVSEWNESDNRVVFPVVLGAPLLPDLYLKSFSASPSAARVGTVVNLTAVVGNGGEAASPLTTVWFLLDSEPEPLAVINLTTLQVAGETSLHVDWNTKGASDITHTLRVSIDIEGGVPESNETNNDGMATVTLSAEVDLAVTGVALFSDGAPSVTVRQNSTARLVSSFANLGSSGSPAAEFSIYLDTVLLLKKNLLPMAGGGSLNHTYEWRVGTTTPGEHTFTVLLDEARTTGDVNWSNNNGTMKMTVLPPEGMPDLIVVSGINVTPANPVVNDTVTIIAFIKNQGNAAAGPFKVYIGFPANGLRLALEGVDRLDAGATTMLTARWSAMALPGTFVIVVRADEEGAVVESNETNNEYNSVIILGKPPLPPGPKLVISGITVSPQRPYTGDRVNITATVKNTGNASSGESTVQFMVDGKIVGTASVPALKPGESVNRTVTWTGSSAGRHTVAVQVQAESGTTSFTLQEKGTGPCVIVVGLVGMAGAVGTVGIIRSRSTKIGRMKR